MLYSYLGHSIRLQRFPPDAGKARVIIVADEREQERNERHRVQRAEEPDRAHQGPRSASLPTVYPTSLLGNPILNRRGNAQVRTAIMLQMQQTYGNRATRRHLQRTLESTALSEHAAPLITTATTVQRIGESLKTKAKVKPAQGEIKGQQRKYDPDQYIAMWEAEQGRKLTPEEKTTVERGCIGITALNLSGGGNPPLDQCYSTFDKAKSEVDKENARLDLMRQIPIIGSAYQDHVAVLFAKMFWSNQNPDPKKRKKADPKAFKPDKKGHVDMSNYHYLARPGFVNFDYAYWDDASQSFWHANHSEPGMIVYQSTREKFAKGYTDFDRVVYCVAIATNYDPKKAVVSHP